MSHLVILTHGFLTTSKSVKKICDKIGEVQSITIFCATIDCTDDGILNAGINLSYMIIEFIGNNKFKYISFIGASMGGLINRVAIGLLTDIKTGTIAGLIPNIYISVATPHLGILDTSIIYKCLAYFVSFDNSTMEDFNLQTKTLFLISDPRTIYFYGLSLFQKRYAFTNIDDDSVVSYTSAGITETYFDFNSKILIVDDYKDNIVIETSETQILQNLQLLNWIRIICKMGKLGLYSHSSASTGFSKDGDCIVDLIKDIIEK
jgi:hypothetical protein